MQNLKTVDWLDEKTRTAAIRKAEHMGHHVGGPQWLFHTNFSVLEDTYFNNSLHSARDMLLRSVRTPLFLLEHSILVQ